VARWGVASAPMPTPRQLSWLVGALVALPTALVAHAAAAEGATMLALLVAVSLAAVAVNQRATAVAPVRLEAARHSRAAFGTPAAIARQCDPDAAGRPRPRAPGRATG